MFLLCFLLFLVTATLATADERKFYYGDKVFRLVPETKWQLNVIKQFLEAPGEQFDFWTMPSGIGQAVDVRVSLGSLHLFSGLMNATQISNQVIITDVQQLIDDVENKQRVSRTSIVGTFPSHNATNDWLVSLCGANPTMATCGDVGHSHENRAIKYIKLGKPSGAVKQKIWIEGTMHAREWLSTGTIVYLIDKLINTYDKDAIVKRMLDTYDWYIIPISNPDGYEYSRTKERMWRKTRSKVSATCYGVDGNRNWAYHWGSGGGTLSPCSETFRGFKAFSEVETKAISDFIMKNKENSRAYFSIHTYGQMWLLPYGFRGTNGSSKLDDYDELLRVAKIGATSLQLSNKKFWQVGTIVDLLYEASGVSIDWTKAEAGIKFSYCLELRPQKGTLSGFIVEENEIEPSGREVWAGLTAAIDAIAN